MRLKWKTGACFRSVGIETWGSDCLTTVDKFPKLACAYVNNSIYLIPKSIACGIGGLKPPIFKTVQKRGLATPNMRFIPKPTVRSAVPGESPGQDYCHVWTFHSKVWRSTVEHFSRKMGICGVKVKNIIQNRKIINEISKQRVCLFLLHTKRPGRIDCWYVCFKY